jgi:hypothetical protein
MLRMLKYVIMMSNIPDSADPQPVEDAMPPHM